MKYLLAVIIILQSFASSSQNCNCLDEFHFVKDHIEKNHGGFNKKIKSPDEPAYKAFVSKLETGIQNDQSGKYCIGYLKKYILYLQDHHSNITSGSGTSIREDSSVAVEAFLKSPVYLNTETVNIDSLEVKKWSDKEPNRIEGIYYTADSTYLVAITKNKTERRDYVAVILKSKSKLWTKGQVKLELKQLNDSLFEIFSYLRNHSLNYDLLAFQKGSLQLNGWLKAGVTNSPKQSRIDNDLIRFIILDSNTTLLSIRTFDAAMYKKLDSAYREVIPEIKKHPHLIIDVRNNGGGSDQSYKALMPLLYTGPYESDVMEYYSTPDNIKAYQDYDDMLEKRASANKNVFKYPIEKMKSVPANSFVSMSNGKPELIAYPKNEGYPVKIAVLYNRNCASSCESLLFESMNSSKTILVGENSGGYTGYGNVMTITTPCGNQLSWTTTVYNKQFKYEFVGIPPEYKIPNDETDWVEYTRRLLNK